MAWLIFICIVKGQHTWRVEKTKSVCRWCGWTVTVPLKAAEKPDELQESRR